MTGLVSFVDRRDPRHTAELERPPFDEEPTDARRPVLVDVELARRRHPTAPVTRSSDEPEETADRRAGSGAHSEDNSNPAWRAPTTPAVAALLTSKKRPERQRDRAEPLRMPAPTGGA